jgi:DNA-directed RNA polymerase specialized sigma subunit
MYAVETAINNDEARKTEKIKSVVVMVVRRMEDILEQIQKKFIYLSYVQGLKLKEIEKELCMSTHRVRKLRDKTLKQLKKIKRV